MSRCLVTPILLVLTLASHSRAPLTAQPAPPFDAKAEAARMIAKGVDFLRKSQKNGMWVYLQQSAQPGKPAEVDYGATALVGLTLLECGVAKDDPAIEAAAVHIRAQASKFSHTYTICLTILFLDRLGAPDDVPAVKRLAERLLQGQQRDGGWTYFCGAADQPPRVSDNSNTQFAILALWAAGQKPYNLTVNAALTRVEQRFRTSQQKNGGWTYGTGPEGSKASMTCVGLLALAVHHMQQRKVSLVGGPAGKPPPPAAGGKKPAAPVKDPRKDKQIEAAVKHLVARLGHGDLRSIEYPYYFLWTLERVCLVYGWDDRIGELAWFEHGVRYLSKKQDANGSWVTDDHPAIAETAFALLFLKRTNLLRETLSGTAELRGGEAGKEPPK